MTFRYLVCQNYGKILGLISIVMEEFFGDSEIYEYFSVEEYYYREQDISKKYKKYFQYLHNKIRVYTRNSFMAQLQFNCTIYYRINL